MPPDAVVSVSDWIEDAADTAVEEQRATPGQRAAFARMLHRLNRDGMVELVDGAEGVVMLALSDRGIIAATRAGFPHTRDGFVAFAKHMMERHEESRRFDLRVGRR